MQKIILAPLLLLLMSVSWTSRKENTPALIPRQDVIKIKFENSCHERASILLYYMKDGKWVSEGWWNIGPGLTDYIANTTNRIFYFYAQSGSYKWRGEWYFSFQGTTYGYQKVEIQSGVDTYIHEITCN